MQSKLIEHPNSGVKKINGKIQNFNVNGVKYSRIEMIKNLSESYNFVIKCQMKQLEKIPNNQKFYIRYEDVVKDFLGVLREISWKFGLNPKKREWPEIPKTQESRNFKYRKDLTKSEINLILLIAKKQ